jgi:hypothetical protein
MASQGYESETEKYIADVAKLHQKIVKAAGKDHQLYLEVRAHIDHGKPITKEISGENTYNIRRHLKKRNKVIAAYVTQMAERNASKEPDGAGQEKCSIDIVAMTTQTIVLEDEKLEGMFRQRAILNIV